jgi:hypothetical protein
MENKSTISFTNFSFLGTTSESKKTLLHVKLLQLDRQKQLGTWLIDA